MQLHQYGFWRDRLQASAIHLVASAALATLAGLLVFGIWYPYPYSEISGGRDLFLLVVTVDVILGPLITLAIFSRRKPLTELRRDLAMVVVVQLSALGYGVWTVAMARPVHMVFEIDRFRVVHAIEVPPELLSQMPDGITALPYTGPTLLALRPFKSANEQADATIAALQGVSLASRPDLWQTYDVSRQDVLHAAKPVAALKTRFPDKCTAIDSVLTEHAIPADAAVYLPLVGRQFFWTVLLDMRNADVLGYVPVDSFE